MIIEFTGLPGSGKSYISRLTGEKLREAGKKVTEPSRIIGHSPALPRMVSKLFHAFLFILLHPFLSAGIYHSVNATGQKSLSSLIKSLLNIYFLLNLVLRYRNSRSIVLLDQGLVQGAASVVYGASGALPGFFEKIPLPDMLIRVHVSPETAVSRLAARKRGGGSRVEKDPVNGLKQFGAALERVEEILLKDVPVVITVDNEDNNPVDLINRLCRDILDSMGKKGKKQ